MARLLFLLFLDCRMRGGIRGVRGSSRGRNEFRLDLILFLEIGCEGMGKR
jgi:hypothetical protein